MVIVDNPGDWDHVYWPLLHAEWHGWTPTDLIFPFFLFMVGVSTTLGRAGPQPWSRVLRRTAWLLGLGWFLAGYPRFDLARWRIPGVLPRIGVCYLASAAIVYLVRRRRETSDGLAMARLVAWAGVLTTIYWIGMMFVPGPTGVAGDLSPAGNLGAWIDRALFGPHLWRQNPWDPEGLASTVPAVATTLAGVVAGLWMRVAGSRERMLRGWFYGGAAALALGLAWDQVFPINKNLWTSSFTWFTAGAAAWALAATSLVFDAPSSRWRDAMAVPWLVLGRNAIALFVVSALVVKTLLFIKVTGAGGRSVSLAGWIYRTTCVPLASPYNASLLYAGANLAVLFALLWAMHRRGWYLRV